MSTNFSRRENQQPGSLYYLFGIGLEPRNGFYALNPCGHVSLCEKCCIKITNDTTPKCPTCRKGIISYLKLYNQAAE